MQDSVVSVCCKRYGIGIPKKNNKPFLKPFSKLMVLHAGNMAVPDLAFHQPGTCKLLGGEIRLKSEVNKGSEFSLVIPVKSNLQQHEPDTKKALFLLKKRLR